MELCAAPVCDRPAKTAGLCSRHYMRQRAGKPIDTPIFDARNRPLGERLMEKVTKTETCWLWTGRINMHGYGAFNIGKRTALVHRVSYQLHKGEIPDDLYVDHMCRVRHCVQPDHLQLVTFRENLENAGVRSDSRTGIRGVGWHASTRKWRVRATATDGTRVEGGFFTDLADAEAAAIALRNRLMTNNLADRNSAA